MSELASQHCIPCRGGMPPLKGDALVELHEMLGVEWEVVDEHHLTRTFTFSDFASGLALVNRIGAIAEEEGHHPDLYLAWGKVRVDLWTHKIDGLVLADFVLAAKIEELPR